MWINKQQSVIQLFSEAKILEALEHPHVIHLKEFYKTESNNLVLILEFCSKGDLNELIENHSGQNLPEEQVTR